MTGETEVEKGFTCREWLAILVGFVVLWSVVYYALIGVACLWMTGDSWCGW